MDSSSATTAPHPIGIKAPSLPFSSSTSSTRKRSRGSSEDGDNGNSGGGGAGIPPSSKEEKRLKARERQRRKRERDRSGRDRSGGSSSMVTLSPSLVPVGVAGVGVGGVFPPPDEEAPQIMNMYGHHHHPPPPPPPPDGLVTDPNSSPDATSTPNGHGRGNRAPSDSSNLTPEEMAKKDRIRVAARERQRKHRAAVKAKRMAEMGIAIVAPGGGVDQSALHYVMNEHGHYDPVMQDPTTAHHSHHPHQHPGHPPHPPPPHPHHLQVLPEPPFPVPQSHMTPGQTFAHTLLLSISCTPMLKQHLLRSLHLSEEELGSLEPMIASAWDHWAHDVRIPPSQQTSYSLLNLDAQRAFHYAAAAGAPVPGSAADHNTPSTSYNIPPHPPGPPGTGPPGPTPPNPTTQPPPGAGTTSAAGAATASTSGSNTTNQQQQQQQQPNPNPHTLYSTDFRERFQRPLVAPFPSNAPILRPMHHHHPHLSHSHMHPSNGGNPSSGTNGSFGDDEGDSDGRDRDERQRGGGGGGGGDERKARSPPTASNNTADSIDPNLESEGTSHVRTAEPKNSNSSPTTTQQQSEPSTDKKLEEME